MKTMLDFDYDYIRELIDWCIEHDNVANDNMAILARLYLPLNGTPRDEAQKLLEYARDFWVDANPLSPVVLDEIDQLLGLME